MTLSLGCVAMLFPTLDAVATDVERMDAPGNVRMQTPAAMSFDATKPCSSVSVRSVIPLSLTSPPPLLHHSSKAAVESYFKKGVVVPAGTDERARRAGGGEMD